ncbi:hypothetical protein C4D60_Mb08t33650 [Musa balbisiana]|uniref:Uncharacterized protein n=1 Tax=Musa balbisiana TaxID=52838 RepID=A0A4S8K8F4_MUSBA|nr:hypothetical protein C4D60_Mb08t33650 [Musa balbisiana]
MRYASPPPPLASVLAHLPLFRDLLQPVTCEKIACLQSEEGVGTYLIKSDYYDDTLDIGPIIDRAVLSSDATLDRDFVTVVFFECEHTRCATCRAGDRSWTSNIHTPVSDVEWTHPEVQFSILLIDIAPYGERRSCAVHGDNESLALFEVDLSRLALLLVVGS